MYKLFFKRFIDLILSISILLITSPLLVIINIWLFFVRKGCDIFFYQERIGQDSIVFKIIKYKTMTDEIDSNGVLLPDEQRLTNFGKFLRSTSIDELPQLLNVVKGEMSIVGPRPLLVEYLPLYSKEQARRHEIKPGITGWAQINGRNSITWQQKFEYDVWYVNNMSLFIDLKIIALTIQSVFNRKNINSKNCITMEPFIGNI